MSSSKFPLTVKVFPLKVAVPLSDSELTEVVEVFVVETVTEEIFVVEVLPEELFAVELLLLEVLLAEELLVEKEKVEPEEMAVKGSDNGDEDESIRETMKYNG